MHRLINKIKTYKLKKIALLLMLLSTHSIAAGLPQGFIIDDAQRIWQVEIAADQQSRNHGLMNRFYLAPWQGMLFLFPEPQATAFWMKNTRIPLDIRFFEASGKALTRYPHAQPCLGDPCPTYPAHGNAAYVLETRPNSWISGNILILWLPQAVVIR